MLKKQNVAKLLLILFILTFGLATMTGCGALNGEDAKTVGIIYEDSFKKSGETCTGYNVLTPPKKGKLGWDPIIGSGFKMVSLSSVATKGGRIAFLHTIAHYIVGALGGSPVCYGSDVCSAQGSALDLSPGNMVQQGLSLGQTITGSFGSLAGVATGILIAVWAMNFIQLVVQERFTMESALKGFCKLILGVLVVQNATNIVSAFMGILSSGAGGGGSFTNFGATLASEMNKDVLAFGLTFNMPITFKGTAIGAVWIDLLNPIMGIAFGIIPLMAQVKCAAQILSAMIITGAEMSLRLAFAPLMFALTSDTGWGQNQISYIKGAMACAVHPAIVMTLIGGIGGLANQIGGAGGLVGEMIATTIAYNILAGFIGEAKQIGHNVFQH